VEVHLSQPGAQDGRGGGGPSRSGGDGCGGGKQRATHHDRGFRLLRLAAISARCASSAAETEVHSANACFAAALRRSHSARKASSRRTRPVSSGGMGAVGLKSPAFRSARRLFTDAVTFAR